MLAEAEAAGDQPDARQMAGLDQFAESFAEQADEASYSPEASKGILWIAHEAFLGPRSSIALLEGAMLAITRSLGCCVRTLGTSSAAETYGRILERMASSCSARDAVVALLAVLDDVGKCVRPISVSNSISCEM